MARAPSPRTEAGRRSQSSMVADGPSARPPWLEEADEDEEAASTLIGRRTFWALVIGLIGLIGGVALGVTLIGRQAETPIDMPATGAVVPLVRSPGPWKVAPTGPGIEGKVVEGQDQKVHGTGDGQDENSLIATDAVAEEPGLRPGAAIPDPDLLPAADATAPTDDADTVALQPAAPVPAPAPKPPAPKPATAATTIVPRADPKPAPKMAPMALPADPVAASGSTLQLGAFSTEGRAREAWKGLSGRFSYLAALTPVILPTAKDGKTLYRLRAATSGPEEARDICGRLRAAGDKCDVVG